MEDLQSSELTTSVYLTERNTKEISAIKRILKEKLELDVSEDLLTNRFISSFLKSDNYVSIFSLTSAVKFSVTEVKKLDTLDGMENRVLDYLLQAFRRNNRIKTLVEVLRTEIKMSEDDSLTEVCGENINITELWKELEDDYNTKFRNIRLRGGIKKLIIKSTIVAFIYKDI